MENQPSENSIKSIERIREYPVIKDSFTKASEYYQWIKEKNATLNSTLTWTEDNLKSVINKVEPIASSKLGTVDNFACNQLDKLENKYPIIKESSENVIKSSGEYYDSSIKPKVDKIVSAKDSAVYIVKTPFRITNQTIDFLSKTSNNFVSSYMSTEGKTASQDVEKREYDVLFRRALKEIDVIKRFTNQNIEGLSNILGSIYNQSVTKNQEWISKYYQEYIEEIKNQNPKESNSELSLMEIATFASNKLRASTRAMSTVCYNHLSPSNKEKMDLVFNKTEHVYSALRNSTLKDVQDQITIDNVKWIGSSSLDLLTHVKDALNSKYKEEVGQEPSTELTAIEDDSVNEEVKFIHEYEY